MKVIAYMLQSLTDDISLILSGNLVNTDFTTSRSPFSTDCQNSVSSYNMAMIYDNNNNNSLSVAMLLVRRCLEDGVFSPISG